MKARLPMLAAAACLARLSAAAQTEGSTEEAPAMIDRRDRSRPPKPDGAVHAETLASRVIVGGQSTYSDVLGNRYQTTAGEARICSSVLVGPKHILKAGHCACDEPGSYRAT